jgi:hypothetical protein
MGPSHRSRLPYKVLIDNQASETWRYHPQTQETRITQETPARASGQVIVYCQLE